MSFEQEIHSMVRQKIMEEINGLGIRAAIREEIEASGVTKGKIRELVETAVDSYVRSVDVKAIVESLIKEKVGKAVASKLKDYVTGWSGTSCTSLLQDIIKQELYREWASKYKAKIALEEIEG